MVSKKKEKYENKKKHKKKKWKLFLLGGILILMVGGLIYFENPTTQSSLSDLKSSILNAFSQGTISPIRTAYNGNYEVKIRTGNESLYDVAFEEKQVSLGFIEYYNEELKKNVSVEQFREDTIICLEAGWDDKEIIEYKWDEKTQEEVIDNTYNYSVPSTLSFYKTNLLSKQTDITRELEKASGISSSYEEGDTYKFCYQANPEKDYYLKFGDNSVIVIQGKDIVGDSLLTNVTAESLDANFTHLNISIEAPYDDLVGYWNFDGDVVNTVGTTAYDFSGNLDGDYLNDTITNSTNCLYGNCVKLDGLGYPNIDSIRIGEGTNNDFETTCINGCTFSAWFYKVGQGASVNEVLLGRSDSAGDDEFFRLDVNNQENVTFIVYEDGQTGCSSSGGMVSLNNWYHALGVFDNSTGTGNTSLYVNGAIVGSTSCSFSGINIGAWQDNEDTYIGGNDELATNPSKSPWNGSIDEVMIFNTSLTAQQILDIYNNQSARFVGTGTQKVRASNITNTSTWDNAGDNRVNLTTTYESNMNSNISARIGQINLSVDPDGLQLYMPFEWGSAVDISGQGNDGTIVNAIFNETGGLNDTGGFEFDGSGDWINVGKDSSIDLQSNLTFSAWVYSQGAGVHGIFGSFNQDEGYVMSIEPTEIWIYTYGASSNAWQTGIDISTNTWTHLAFTYNSSDLVLYMNGSSVATTARTGLIDQATNYYHIGSWRGTTYEFDGSIDEVMIFNRSLSANEITALYGNQSNKYNTAYYTPYQNLSGTLNIFNISNNADFIFPDFNFLADNESFYTPLLLGDIQLDIWNFTEAPVGDANPVSILSRPADNNETPQGVVTFECNATDDSNLMKVNLTVWNKTGLDIITTKETVWNGTSNSTTFTYDFTSDDDYEWNCLSYDNASQTDWADANFTLTITTVISDTEYPIFSTFTETPADEATYVFGQTYEFNTTILSTNGTVGLDFNGTNYTASNLTADVYNVTLTNFHVENFTYYWWARGNGSNTLFNNTQTYSYNVTKAIPEGNLTNTTSWTITYSTEVTIGLEEGNNGDSDLEYNVSRDGTGLGTGETITLGVGSYEYILNTTGGANYTSNISMDNETLIVNQIQPSINLSLNNTQGNLTINQGDIIDLNCSILTGDSGTYLELYQEETLINNGTTPIGNITTFNTVQEENITCIYPNSQNYTLNTTEFFVDVVDLINPVITITYPLNNSNLSSAIFDLNYTFVETNSDSCWYSNDSGAINSTSVSMGTNWTALTGAEGNINRTIYCNDTTNNLGLMIVSFTIDTINPDLSVPANTSLIYNNELDVVFNATDSGSGIDSWVVNDSTNFVINSTGGLKNNTVLSVGFYILNISVNDSANNINDTLYSIEINGTSNLDLFFSNTTDLTTYKTVFDEGENFWTYINWTDELGKSLNNSVGECNVSLIEGLQEVESTDDNFTICGTGCDYSTYSEVFTMETTTNAVMDIGHALVCNEQLQQQDAEVNISCDGGAISYFETRSGAGIPLCSVGNSLVMVNTSVCVGFTDINVSVTYGGIFQRRKRVLDLAIDREYSLHTVSGSDGNVIFNDTLQLWQTNHTHEYYKHGSKTISANCSHDTDFNYDNSTIETITIVNAPPQILDSQMTNNLGTFKVNGTLESPNVYEYVEGLWNWSISIVDDDIDTHNETWYNSSGDAILSYQHLGQVAEHNSSDGLFANFLSENTYNLTIWANDTFGNLTIKSFYFNVTDTTFPQINITYPENYFNTTNTGLHINYTYSNIDVDSCWYSNDTYSANTTLASCGTNITDVTWVDGEHNVTIWINDSSDNQNSSSINFTIDTTQPSFDEALENQTLVYNNALLYDINASDETLFDGYVVNDTINFKINISTGILENNTILGVNEYPINITINDSFNNLNSSVIIINITQATPIITKMLNGVDDNLTVVYPQQINATASTDFGTLNFTRDGTDVTSENGLNITLGVANYYYEFNITGNQNYSNVSESLYANVTIATGLIYLYLDNSRENATADNNTAIDINATLQTGVGNIQIYDNGTLSNNGSSPLYNSTSWATVEVRNITAIYSGNTNYTRSSETWWVNITEEVLDTTAPTITDPRNFTQAANQSFSEDMSATDTSGISFYWLNQTNYFNITQSGVIANATNLSRVEIHWLNYSVNDTFNNIQSLIFYINITAAPIFIPLEGNITIGGLNKIERRVIRLIW